MTSPEVESIAWLDGPIEVPLFNEPLDDLMSPEVGDAADIMDFTDMSTLKTAIDDVVSQEDSGLSVSTESTHSILAPPEVIEDIAYLEPGIDLQHTLVTVDSLKDEGAESGIPLPSINELIKTVVIIALGKPPAAGDVLSALVSLFWPTASEDNWPKIRTEIERVVEQQLSQGVFRQLHQKLRSTRNALFDFLKALKNGDNEYIRAHFTTCKQLFTLHAPHFQVKEHEWVVAPLYGIYAQLHMSLLRDGVLHGQSWGFDQKALNDINSDFVTWGRNHDRYLQEVAERRRAMLASSAPSRDRHRVNVYNYWQPFHEQHIRLIHDYRVLLSTYRLRRPNTQPIVFQDVYSRAFGSADEWDAEAQKKSRRSEGVSGVYSAPSLDFRSIDLELSNNRPRAIRVNHVGRSGPRLHDGRRVESYDIIGAPTNGIEKRRVLFPGSQHDKLYRVHRARVRDGNIPLSLTLYLDTGEAKQMWHHEKSPGSPRDWFNVQVPGRMLSTLNMWTRSKVYDRTLGCIIFGFSRDPRRRSRGAQQAAYVGAIQEPEKSVDYEMRRARMEYWDSIELIAAGNWEGRN